MRTRHSHSGALIFVLASLSCVLHAQPQIPPSHLLPVTHLSDADKGPIKLDVIVTDNAGNPISGLNPKDFALSENGQPNPIISLQSFNSVSTNSTPPCEIILVIDAIDMPNYLARFQWGEVDKFLRQNSGHTSCAISIYRLSQAGFFEIAQPSTDSASLEKSIAHPDKGRLVLPSTPPPGFATVRAIGFIAAAERPKPGRKMLLWVGMTPNRGEYIRDQQQLFNAIVWFSTLLRDSRVVLYSIDAGEQDTSPFPYKNYAQGTPSAQSARLFNLAVPVLAMQSGGRALGPGNSLAKQLNSCVEDSATFYELSFNPLPAANPDEYHTLKVHIDKPELSARTRTGYYDQPWYTDQPYHAVRQVTVAQLQQFLKDASHESDSDIARELSDLKLTERLSSPLLTSWLNTIPGKKTRQALVAMADLSAFLDPPPTEISAHPPPDINAQDKLVSNAIDYLKKTIPQLPNLFATRTTVLYTESPPQYIQAGKAAVNYQPLHAVSTSNAHVQVRDGKEVLDSATMKKRNSNPLGANLTIQGTFGPILVAAIQDALAPPSTLSWSRWEKGPDHLYAVFRYTAPSNRSHYSISNCCLPGGDGTGVFQMQTAYFGEIVIDPVTSAIVRLSLVANLKPGLPVNQSNTMVEYGPVDIGGKSYIVPVKSVSIMRAQTVRSMQMWGESFRTIGPYSTNLDDMVFTGYHIFRSSSRVLPGFNPTP